MFIHQKRYIYSCIQLLDHLNVLSVLELKHSFPMFYPFELNLELYHDEKFVKYPYLKKKTNKQTNCFILLL